MDGSAHEPRGRTSVSGGRRGRVGFERWLGGESGWVGHIIEFSVQKNHIHLIVEATNNDALARGMKSFTVRSNRLFNAASGRRRGKVWADRYHRADLNTPRQVRNALVYVINNGRKHGEVTALELVIDACSSAPWFAGWTMPRSVREGPRPTEEPRTFLLARLWLKHGRIHPNETPGSRVQ